MRRTAMLATGLSVVLLSAALVVVPGPAAGGEDPWGPEDLVGDAVEEALGDKKKDSKSEGKTTYVSLGVLGDVAILCPGVEEVEEVDAGGVVVDFYDPDSGESPEGDVGVPFKFGFNDDSARPDSCIGGAVGDYPEGTDATVWDVWIHDYVWDNLEGPLEYALDHANLLLQQDKDPKDHADRFTVDFKTAGFARMVVEYEYDEVVKGDPGTTSDCVPSDDGKNLTVCVQTGTGTHSASRSINNFGFCGQGVIDTASGMLEPFDIMADPAAPGDSLERVNKEATKVVFVDSLAFFLFDCSLQGGEVEGLYNQITGYLNEGVDAGGPIPPGVLQPLPDGTCNDAPPVPNLVCFFEFPSPRSQCFADKQDPNPKHMNLPVVGIVGTIGWSHDPTQADGKCRETPSHNDWFTSEPGAAVVVKNSQQPIDCTAGIYRNAVLWGCKGGNNVVCKNDHGIKSPDLIKKPSPYQFTVECHAPNACFGDKVVAEAELLAGATSVKAEVRCGDNPATDAAIATPTDSHDIEEGTKQSGDYRCIMTFDVADGNAFIGNAQCRMGTP